MKRLFLLFLIFYNLKIALEKSITIQPEGIMKDYSDCSTKEGVYFIVIKAITEGFTERYNFTIPLKTPKYGYASCTALSDEEATTQMIPCTIVGSLFPLIDSAIIFDESTDWAKDFTLKNWEIIAQNATVIESIKCIPEYLYSFYPSNNSIVVDNCDTTGQFHILEITGNFNREVKKDSNLLTSTESLSFKIKLRVDNEYEDSTCTLNTLSEKTDEGNAVMKCTVKGNKKVIIFETMGEEDIEKSLILIGEKEVNLKTCGGNSINKGLSYFSQLGWFLILLLFFN